MKNIKILLMGGVFLSHLGIAQTTNIGELVILPNSIMGIGDQFINGEEADIENNGELHLASNYLNEGSHYSSTGSLHLVGSELQLVNGTTDIILNDLILSNSGSGVDLNGTVRVNGTMTFNNGVFEVDTILGTLYFEEDANQSSAWDGSYVQGLQFKNGSNSFIFPCGDSGIYRPAEIASPDLLTDQFSCQYKLDNSNTVHSHSEYKGIIEQINDTEYWVITREEGSSEVKIGLSYNSEVTPTFIMDNINRVHVVRWDESKSAWVDEGGVHNAANQTIYTVGSVKNYGIYTLAVVEEEYSSDELVVYNLVTPNGNGQNDVLMIDGIEKFPNNRVTIINRWGEPVFETSGYDNHTNAFVGYANQGITNMSAMLPDGTYFYVLYYTAETGSLNKKVGYFQLSQN